MIPMIDGWMAFIINPSGRRLEVEAREVENKLMYDTTHESEPTVIRESRPEASPSPFRSLPVLP